MQKTLSSGIYPPLPTFFDAQEDLDLATLQRHIRRLANTGIAGYVLMGSNGEAVHLTDEERAQVLSVARETLTELGSEQPIVAGCGAQSTRATIALATQAAQYGADFALILPPSYYKGRMDTRALIHHFQVVADESPLPVVIYNMPASAAGIDLDAETIATLSEHPNIVGVKDSSGNVIKLARLVSMVKPTFRIFAGSADFLLPTLVAGGVGAVAALANVFPRTVCHLQELYAQQKLEEARILQARIIPANAAVTSRFGIAGLKAALENVVGYGGRPRLPLQPLTPQEAQKLQEILSAMPQENE
ncbi:MAG TPA: dihydrodipicolinate synthase family protein [Dictyobacter sp.]|nr:dihydrodipicolinate synthase family protein [Dictyobacter sp.]